MAEWKTVASVSDISAGRGLAVNVDGKALALFNIEGKFYAINDECTHAGGSLSEGFIEGNAVACPWHDAKFDITTGKALSAPACEDAVAYNVRVQDGQLQVEI